METSKLFDISTFKFIQLLNKMEKPKSYPREKPKSYPRDVLKIDFPKYLCLVG